MNNDLKCADCGRPMVLSNKPDHWVGPSRYIYLCQGWPECRGKLTAHPDGTPHGIPANAQTREARRMLHILFDPLWQRASFRKAARTNAYSWLSAMTGIPEDKCHIGMMSLEELHLSHNAITQHQPTPASIWEWYKTQKERVE